MTQYRKRYLVESSRLKGWDYSANGWYYITIITKNWECFLGQISNGIMQLSDIGSLCWKNGENHLQYDWN
jgi:putative transposase